MFRKATTYPIEMLWTDVWTGKIFCCCQFIGKKSLEKNRAKFREWNVHYSSGTSKCYRASADINWIAVRPEIAYSHLPCLHTTGMCHHRMVAIGNDIHYVV